MTKNNLKEIEGRVQEIVSKMTGKMETVANQLSTINTPLSKKDIVINGQNCSMSLLKDGRIMIGFPALDVAQKYYDEPPVKTEQEHLSIRNKWYHNGKIDGIEYHHLYWKHSNFIKRMFNMVKLPERTRV